MPQPEDDVLDLDEQNIIADPDDSGDAHEPGEGDDTPGVKPEPDDGDDYVTFGDDEPQPVAETPLIKQLRHKLREREQELAQYRRAPTEEPIVVGEKPTLASCEYDEVRLDQELDAYHERRRAANAQKSRQDDARRRQEEAWSAVTTNYATKKVALPFKDKDEVEAAAFDTLSVVQQAVIAKVADDPALFIYAAGRNPGRLAELAKIEDPLILSKTVAKMEATMKTGKRAKPPEPDTPVRGKAAGTASANKVLERLEREAEKSGNRTELNRYKKANGLA